jgi:hypothetical protein
MLGPSGSSLSRSDLVLWHLAAASICGGMSAAGAS